MRPRIKRTNTPGAFSHACGPLVRPSYETAPTSDHLTHACLCAAHSAVASTLPSGFSHPERLARKPGRLWGRSRGAGSVKQRCYSPSQPCPILGALGYELLNRPPGSCDQRLALQGFLTGINDSVCNKPIRMRCISRVFLYLCPFTVLEAYEHRPRWRNARRHEPSRGARADATLSIHQVPKVLIARNIRKYTRAEQESECHV